MGLTHEASHVACRTDLIAAAHTASTVSTGDDSTDISSLPPLERLRRVVLKAQDGIGKEILEEFLATLATQGIVAVVAGLLSNLTPAAWIGRGVAAGAGAIAVLQFVGAIRDALGATTQTELDRAADRFRSIEASVGVGAIEWIIGAALGKVIGGVVGAVNKKYVPKGVHRPAPSLEPFADDPAVVLRPQGATEGPLSGVRTIQDIETRVQALVEEGRLKQIGEASEDNKVYLEYGTDGRPTGHVVRVGTISPDEVQAAIDAWRLGVGPRILVNRSWYNGVDHGILTMQYVKGQTLREWLASLGARRPQATKIVIDFVQKVAQLHGHGWAHWDLHPGNALVEEPGGAVKIIDYTKARRLPQSLYGVRDDLNNVVAIAGELKPPLMSMKQWMKIVADAYLGTLDHIPSDQARHVKTEAQKYFNKRYP